MNKKENPKTHTVSITLTPSGDLEYVNPLIWVDRGDKIIWECTNRHAFTVHLGWNSPLENGRLRAKKGNNIDADVPMNAPPGYYRYTVAVYDEDEIWTDDPELIVKRPGR